MPGTTEGQVPVPGASLFYRLRGEGPLLLLLPGGDGDADACEAMATHLEARFRVLAYDRRGLSRSVCDDRTTAPGLLTHVEGDAPMGKIFRSHWLPACLSAVRARRS